jgi:hypothetical protein
LPHGERSVAEHALNKTHDVFTLQLPLRLGKPCSQICVDGQAAEHYIVSTGQMKEVGRSPAKKIRSTSHTRTDPKAARSPSCPAGRPRSRGWSPRCPRSRRTPRPQ